MQERIGIFGGTFDPVHFGHLRPALELKRQLRLSSVRLLPCHRPSHRDTPGATTRQRIDMLSLAIDGCDGLVIDTRESERDAPSYTVDTLLSFRQESPNASLLFFMGMDAFAGFTGWHRWETILELAHLVVIERPGSEVSGAEERLLMQRQAQNVSSLTDTAGSIIVQSVSQSDISATRIRTLVSQGEDIRFLLPEAVREYILDHRLYRDGKDPTAH